MCVIRCQSATFENLFIYSTRMSRAQKLFALSPPLLSTPPPPPLCRTITGAIYFLDSTNHITNIFSCIHNTSFTFFLSRTKKISIAKNDANCQIFFSITFFERLKKWCVQNRITRAKKGNNEREQKKFDIFLT